MRPPINDDEKVYGNRVYRHAVLGSIPVLRRSPRLVLVPVPYERPPPKIP